MNYRIAVLGGGSWGTALANLLAYKDYKVKLWVRDSQQKENLNKKKENEKYLPGIKLSDNIEYTDNIGEAIENKDIIVSAIPVQSTREVLKKISKTLDKETILINVSKGIETESLMRVSEIVKEELGDIKYGVLSGPSHAEEVGLRMPTTVVASSTSKKVAETIQDAFMTPEFRVYTNPDLIGVELGGALKNIIAIGAGVSDGLKFGDNTRAALISRGFVEIARLGVAMGAREETFSGLSGIGDLIVTCSSKHSRNRRAGILIGEGHKLDGIVREVGMVVEGIKTTEATQKLSKKLNVDMPITNEIYNTIYGNTTLEEAMSNLMMRNKKCEMEDIAKDNKISWNE